MKIILILATLAVAGQLVAQTREEIRREPGANPVSDSVVIKNVLKVVTDHVRIATRNGKRPLVVKVGKKSRRFVVREILGAVYRNRTIYTAQLDADEFDHKIPRILYVDVRKSKGNYRVVKVRIGPNRFRDL